MDAFGMVTTVREEDDQRRILHFGMQRLTAIAREMPKRLLS